MMRNYITLALLVCLGMANVASAQQAAADRGVQRTASNTGGTAAATSNGPTPGLPAVIGTIDMDSVFKNYEKVKVSSDDIAAKAMAKQNELQKLVADMKTLAEKQASLSPSSPEFKKLDQQLTQMKITGEAAQESARKELAQVEAEALSALYREIQSMTARVAAWRGMNYVVKVSNEQPSSADPQAVMAILSRTVVYSDPRNDITQQVVQFLNQEYRKVAAAQPRSAAGAAATAAPAAAAQPATTRGN